MDANETLLTRGVEKIYPSKEELEKVLRSGKKLRIYQGFDPTGIELHIGHLIGLRKLRQFQEAGHEVIFLIGDGTGQAGDPSGKTRAREKFLTQKELRRNAEDYVRQAAKVIRFEGENAVKIKYNGDWLNKLTLPDILNITGYFSAQQLFERDLFQERFKKGERFSFREFLYPLLQAYDSVAMEVDLEIGGSDQTFNMLMGRHLVSAMQKREKFVLTTPLLADSTGKKIGKTEGNVIALRDSPADLYGKIMSLSDEVIVKGLEYLTDLPMEEVKSVEQKMQKGDNPMQFKKLLAFEIVKSLNSEKAAREAQSFFREAHQKQQAEKVDLQTVHVREQNTIMDCLTANFGMSKSEVKRLVEQKAIDVNGKPVENTDYILKPNDTVRVGKHLFFKVK
ncbi:MAG: tyrosine--tRNA ligase [Patescibacteria group bacterium]|nr:tyrosine--tRNA ligase [Patescibacteria group bacterium]